MINAIDAHRQTDTSVVVQSGGELAGRQEHANRAVGKALADIRERIEHATQNQKYYVEHFISSEVAYGVVSHLETLGYRCFCTIDRERTLAVVRMTIIW